MPRIPNTLIRKALSIDPYLPSLLAPCRDLHAAQNELRWIREHVDKAAEARRARGENLAQGVLLWKLVKERSRGKPLQYILGTEWFGDLEIGCRSGVLIPRQDTAASITHLAQLLGRSQDLPEELRILDLCTGTGCIPLLLRHELGITRADVRTDLLGVDISSKALKLARLNSMKIHKDYVAEYQGTIQFLQADILLDQAADRQNGLLPLRTALKRAKQPSSWDILISNPPYISPSHYWKTTTRSVRQYEPKLALVPPPKSSFDDIQQGDRFYPRLLDIAKEIEARVVLLEVADMDQAMRVAQAAKDIGIFDGVEIWREHPGAPSDAGSNDSCHGFKVIGEGNGRSVLCYRGIGASWLGKTGTVTETVPEI